MSAQLHLVEPYQPTEADIALENRMKDLRGRIDAMQEEYFQMHRQRSPAFIDWLERKQGLKRDGK